MSEQENPPLDEAAPKPPAAPAGPTVPQQAFGDAPPAPGAEGTFGAAPGTPLTAGEAFGTAPEPAKKKGGVLKIVGAVVAVLLVLCIVGVFLAVKGLGGADTDQAKAGDCIGNLPTVAEGEDKQANDAKVVDCTSADAAYKVEGRLENKTEAEAKSEEVCSAYANAQYIYRAIDPSAGKGYVLCLSAVGAAAK